MPPSPQGLELAQHLLDWGRRQTQQRYPLCKARPIHTVGILGAGLTGSRLALLVRRAGWNLVVVDARQEALDRLAARLAQSPIPSKPMASDAPAPWVGQGDKENVLDSSFCAPSCTGREPWVQLTPQVASLAGCDLVLECVPEKPLLKQEVLHQAETYLTKEAVLASNTSTIPVQRLSERLRNPERCCGIHFFMPIPFRPVVELVPGPAVSTEAMSTAAGFILGMGFTPLVVEDGPGFLANRLLLAWLNEAMQLLEEGYQPMEIDRHAVAFGWALGPFALMDWIGLDVVVSAAWELAGVFGDWLVRSPILVAMVKKGYLGRKTGAGFYRYDLQGAENLLEPTGSRLPHPDVLYGAAERPEHLLLKPPPGPFLSSQSESVRRTDSPRPWAFPEGEGGSASGKSEGGLEEGASLGPPADGILKTPKGGGPPGESTCTDRLHLAMLAEAVHMLDQQRAKDPREVDLVVVWGLGFPAFRGGLLRWTDQQGLGAILQRGERYRTSTFLYHSAYPKLWERVHTQTIFYPNQPEQLER